MTVHQLRQLLGRLPADFQHTDVIITLDGEVDTARVLMLIPPDITDPDDEGPSVILAGSLDDYASRYVPAAPLKVCECGEPEDTRLEGTP